MFLDWKNQHCENDSTTQSYLKDSVLFLPKFQWYVSQIENTMLKFVQNYQKLQPKQFWKRRNNLDASHFLISNYTTKLLCHNQNSMILVYRYIDQWTRIQSSQDSHKFTLTYTVNYYFTSKPRILSRNSIVYSINGQSK